MIRILLALSGIQHLRDIRINVVSETHIFILKFLCFMCFSMVLCHNNNSNNESNHGLIHIIYVYMYILCMLYNASTPRMGNTKVLVKV